LAELKNRPQSKDKKSMLKMKELVTASCVPKSTILLYVKQGLLPKPFKTSPNMAYYDPACIEQIAFIKQAQSTHRLPLAAIKGLIREMEKGRDVDLMLELQTQVFGSGKKSLGKKAFCSATGLNKKQLDQLCLLKLINPLEDGLFNEQDKAMGILLMQSIKLGMNPVDLAFYPKLAKQMVDKELKLREQHTKNLKFAENASLTIELTRMARSIRSYVIDRTMQKQLMEYKGLRQ
jgi:DNA-binding transcriptional MerR regulator